MTKNIAIKRFVANEMKDNWEGDIQSGISLKKFSRSLIRPTIHFLFSYRCSSPLYRLYIKIERHVDRMWCVQVNFLTRHHRLLYVLDTHESSINEIFSLVCFFLSLSVCVCMYVYVCMHVCMINSICTRSRRVISCNNTSRRSRMNLLHEPINDDDNHGQILLVERKKREERRAGWQKKTKVAKWQWQKGKIDRYLFVSGVLISINNYRHWQRPNSNDGRKWWDLFISF